MKRIMCMFLALAICLPVVACAPARTGPVYTREETKTPYEVHKGEVTQVEEVAIKGEKSVLGYLGGAVVGGALGSAIGSGSGQTIATAIGAVGGALAGAAVEERATENRGLRITVSLESGKDVVVVQEADTPFSVGEKVKVIVDPRDKSARVVK